MTKQHAPAQFWRCLAGRSWALVMAAAWSLAGANGDIVIGELALQRPEASIEAAAYMSGLQLSLDQANAAGGVRGRRVVLARAPNAVAMDQAAAEAERLLSGSAVALV
jgi:ABC-type branched-subunit amino acid transport system substrate-binding protein